MKRILVAAALGVLAHGAMAADVGVSISIGDPNFYGRLDIGNFPRPALLYPQPMVIQPVPRGVALEPLYLRVPPGHAKNWRKHCARYNACGHPVYFVQDRWYNDVYAPRYRSGPEYRSFDGGRPEYRREPDYRPRERHEERRERRDDRGDRRDERGGGWQERGDGERGGGQGHGHGRGGREN
ncbi:hypothetical protein [Zoogloea sp. LCSB751]|uniref:hypothetical protein n=1 Tax=Zoogloea sp. LCSB751 TaxID=1965277 RepID=UPI0009A4EE03|nr:hypothetical protein [Zoogloea sp. LCSB751]